LSDAKMDPTTQVGSDTTVMVEAATESKVEETKEATGGPQPVQGEEK